MKSSLRKSSSRLHLWLGLFSGIVVFIVCITGSLYVFRDEISDLRQPWKFIQAEDTAMLPPSELLAACEASTGFKASEVSALTYGEGTDAVRLDFFSRESSAQVFINPYNGEIIKVVKNDRGEFDFFSFVLTGHRTLWLPRAIGKPIVGFGVLIFLITLVTGAIMWWPKKWNRKTFKNNFTIKFKVPLHRINWKLHNVLGGYALIILIICSLTGLIWSFQWFSKSVYYLTSGGKQEQPYRMPNSDDANITRAIDSPVDSLFYSLQRERAPSYYYALPRDSSGVIRVSVVHKRGSYYRTDNLFFDQYTLQPLEGSGPYAGKYKEAAFADKLRRINLELHDGRILGLPGKIMAFFASLIGASLPVTGYIIWFNKMKNKRRSRKLR